MTPVLRVLDPGMHATFQDLGRAASLTMGVAPSGAFDLDSWRTANHLVGNDTAGRVGGPVAIEVLVGGMELCALQAIAIGVAGAHPARRYELEPGQQLSLPRIKRGLRTYVAVPGGFNVDRQLGSGSWDSAAELGPPPISTCQMLSSTDQPDHAPVLGAGPSRDQVPVGGDVELWPGPHWQLAADSGFVAGEGEWVVTPQSSRAGIRLTRSMPARASFGSLSTTPTIPGTVQLLPDGDLVVFGPDGPVTGGYPVVGVVAREQLDRLGQTRPGQPVRFVVRPSKGTPARSRPASRA